MRSHATISPRKRVVERRKRTHFALLGRSETQASSPTNRCIQTPKKSKETSRSFSSVFRVYRRSQCGMQPPVRRHRNKTNLAPNAERQAFALLWWCATAEETPPAASSEFLPLLLFPDNSKYGSARQACRNGRQSEHNNREIVVLTMMQASVVQYFTSSVRPSASTIKPGLRSLVPPQNNPRVQSNYRK